MKKLFKILLTLFAIVLLLLGAAVVALKIFFPAEKVKALVLDKLQQQLKREVTIDKVSIGLLKGLGLTQLKISEASTFAQGTFVSVDDLSVRVQWRPLLQKRIVVDSIVLNKPMIHVKRFADGKTFNFSDLLTSSKTVTQTARLLPAEGGEKGRMRAQSNWSLVAVAEAAPTQAATPAPQAFDLRVVSFQIKEGHIVFEDASTAKMNADISGANVRVRNFTTEEFFDADWKAVVKVMGLLATVQGVAKVNLKTEQLRLSDLALAVGESIVKVTGDVQKWSAAAPVLALQIVLEAFNAKDFAAVAGLPPEFKWTGLATGGVKAKGDLSNLDLSGTVSMDAVDLQYGKTFVKPAKVPMTISFEGRKTTNMAEFYPFGLKLGSLSATGRLRIDGLTQKLPVLKVHLDTNEFPLTEVAAFSPGSIPKEAQLSGPVKISADLSGTSAATHVSAKVYAKDLSVTYGNSFRKPAGVLMDLALQADSLDGGNKLAIQSLNFRLAQLVGTLAGTYQKQGTDAKAALTLKTNEFPLDDLPKLLPAAATYSLSGTGKLDAQITGLVSAPPIQGTLVLQQASVKAPEGEIQGIVSTIRFAAPNAQADEAHQTLKTDGQFNAIKVKHEFYNAQDLKFTWNLTEITQTLDRVSGVAQLNQGPGTLRNLEKLAQHSKAAKLALTPIQVLQKVQAKGVLKEIGLPSLESVPFDSLRGDYAFRSGTMDIKTFDLVGKDLTLNTQGTIGLAGAQPLDLKAVAKLAPGAIRGTLGQIIQDEQGRPTFKFTVTGTAENPKTKYDVQETGKKALQILGNELLKGLQKNRDSAPSDPNAPAASNNAQDPQKSLEDLGNSLKDLFKKR